MRHNTKMHCGTLPNTVLMRVMRLAQRLALGLTLGLTLGLAGNTHAQSINDPGYDPSAGAAQSGNTRSLFLGTIAAMVAQSLGSGIGSALSEGIGGSITRWFNSEPSPSAGSTAAATPVPAPRLGGNSSMRQASERKARKLTDPKLQPAVDIPAPVELHAGVAFEVHRIDRKGKAKAVDPARHAFRTGDRFQVFYRPSLPGRVKVVNVNPSGQKTRIETVDVAAGELVALGPYEFVDAKGDETLKLILEPCSTPLLTASTRSIIKTTAVAADAKPPIQIRDCGDLKSRDSSTTTRSIRKSTMVGSTAFALDRLTKDEMRTGNVGARSIQITLRHR